MTGAIVGDIVGSVYEFDNIKTKQFELFHPEADYTDDTIMTCATADAILSSQNYLDETDPYDFSENCLMSYKKFGRASPFPLGGYGTRFSQWLHSTDSRPYNSFGNGSAMRVSPVAWAAKSLQEALELAKISASVTHNHEEGIKGAQATAACIYFALHDSTKDKIKDYIVNNFYPAVADMKVDDIRTDYHFEGSCQNTVPQAICAFLESDGFEDAIRTGVSLGGDSDTLCAITGSIAEAYYGIPKEIYYEARSYIPVWMNVTVSKFETKYGRKIT